MVSLMQHKREIEEANQRKINKAFGSDADKVLSARDIGTDKNWKESFKTEGIQIPNDYDKLAREQIKVERDKKRFEERSNANKDIKDLLSGRKIYKSEVKHAKPQSIKVEKKNYGLKTDKKLMRQIKDKIRSDRLAKKELRVAEMKSRIRRLQKADRQQMGLQRKLARILNRRKPEEINNRLYSSNAQQVGGILNTPNLFTQSDNRTKSARDSGSILNVPNILMPSKKDKSFKQRWI